MYSIVWTAAVYGLSVRMISVEADVSEGLPVFDMVGYPGAEVKEARERVRTAMKNSGYLIPPKRITVNLSPVNLRKEGNAYDLPVAVALMNSLGIIQCRDLSRWLVLGEIGLDGKAHTTGCILPIAAEAKKAGCVGILLPQENVAEAQIVEGLKVKGVRSLQEAVRFFNTPKDKRVLSNIEPTIEEPDSDALPDFCEVAGQQQIKRACEIAAAGMHHLLMIGSPGSGKTMIASRIPTILPDLTSSEQMEISKIYSIAGLLDAKNGLMHARPYRHPHHTVTVAGMTGGGRIPKPGEITLASGGVLFLDEVTEFQRPVLETLRQPLEEQKIRIVRQSGVYEYPADLMLVCACNPCRCGYYPDRNRCSCTPEQVRSYLSRMSGPLLDRIDICVEAPRISFADLTGTKQEETSAQIRRRVQMAHDIQRERYKGTGIRFNSRLSGADVGKFCSLSSAQHTFMEEVYTHFSLTARSYFKILKVARTIADLDGRDKINRTDLSEAVSFKSLQLTGGSEVVF